MPDGFTRFRPQLDRKELNKRRDECLWNYILTFGSRVRVPPELPIDSVAQSAEQKGSFHNILVVTHLDKTAANAGWNYSSKEWDAP